MTEYKKKGKFTNLALTPTKKEEDDEDEDDDEEENDSVEWYNQNWCELCEF